MADTEFLVELLNDGRVVGSFTTIDSARVATEQLRWQAFGPQHVARVTRRPRFVEQQDVEPIPADEYLCQA